MTMEEYLRPFEGMGEDAKAILNDDNKLRELTEGLKKKEGITWEKPSERKQANVMWNYCFRNTTLERYHGEGFITDNEMKNTSIETCARLEYLLLQGSFLRMKPKEIFLFTFKTAYQKHVEKDLGKGRWNWLSKEMCYGIQQIQSMMRDKPVFYECMVTIKSLHSYFDEDIKFNGEKLTDDPNKIKVGHQYLEKVNKK